MHKTRNRWVGTIAAATLLMATGSAWGFSIKAGSGNWDHVSSWSSDRHEFGDRWSGRYGGGMMDDDSDSAGRMGYDFNQGRGFNWDGGWIKRYPWNIEGKLGRKGWREFMLEEMIAGSGLSEWADFRGKIWAFKKQIWSRLIEHYREHHYAETTQVPLPATLLLFGSGLAGLAGFVRRSRKVSAYDKIVM